MPSGYRKYFTSKRNEKVFKKIFVKKKNPQRRVLFFCFFLLVRQTFVIFYNKKFYVRWSNASGQIKKKT